MSLDTSSLTDIATIKAAIATRIGTVAGIKAAYALTPDALPDGPVANITWDGSEVVLDSAFTEYEHVFTVDVLVRSLGAAVSEQKLLPFVTSIAAKLRTEHTLGGLVVDMALVQASPIEPVAVGDVSMDRLPLRLRVRDAAVVAVG